MKDVIHWLDDNLEKVVCVALFMIFTAIMVVNVFMRYVVRQAIPWASDLVLFLFVWFVWFAVSYGFKAGAHVNVTAVTGMLPEKVQRILSILCYSIAFAGFVYIFYFGVRLMFDASVVGKYGLLIKYPMWSLYLATPIGAALSMIRILQILWGLCRKKEAE